ncbi:hypothetical protein LCGC14_0245470 [marine sediment metagenome]|uniref:Uncharacterized protein n=1 Tax=marine sediment metagenome TaxID=412755 RepID=A0A0F9WR02_9ZZZZ
MESVEHNLIIIDQGTDLPVFNPEARTIVEFKDLIASARRRGMSHDIGKRRATALMAGVFFMSSFKSPYYGRSGKEAKILAQVAHLEEKDVKSKEFQAACKRFEKIEYVPDIEALDVLVSALRLSLVFVQGLKRNLEAMLGDNPERLDIGTMDLVQTSINKLVDMADKIPATIEKVETSLTRVKKQTETRQHRKGGRVTHLRED